jgi:hypothetical protein
MAKSWPQRFVNARPAARGGACGRDAGWLLLRGICGHEPTLKLNPDWKACILVHGLFRIVKEKIDHVGRKAERMLPGVC